MPDQIRQWVPGSYRTLGTDGYGRSDFRTALRRFFEVDRHYVAVAALKELADAGAVDAQAGGQGDQKVRDRRGRPDADDGMSATLTKVEVPDIGDFDDVPVIEILVSVGDSVAVEDPLVTLESDKATMDVPAPLAGVVREISVSVGDRVSQGSMLMSLEGGDDDRRRRGCGWWRAGRAGRGRRPGRRADDDARRVGRGARRSRQAGARAAAEAPQPRGGPQLRGGPRARARETNGGGPIYASPSARRLARELGVDLRSVTGSGRKGRITKEDVQSLADGKGAGGPGRLAPGSVRGGAGGRGRPGPAARGRRWTSRSSARWSASSARGSSASPRRTWRATG